MTNEFKKLRGRLNKDLTTVTVEIPIGHIDFKKPIGVSKRGYAGFGDNYYQFEIEIDGAILPIDGKIGMYVSPKNWKSFKDQIAGKKEGEKQGTNTPEISPELMKEFQQFLEFKKMMSAKK